MNFALTKVSLISSVGLMLFQKDFTCEQCTHSLWHILAKKRKDFVNPIQKGVCKFAHPYLDQTKIKQDKVYNGPRDILFNEN